jgi:hypothetical protein
MVMRAARERRAGVDNLVVLAEVLSVTPAALLADPAVRPGVAGAWFGYLALVKPR